MAVDYDTLAKQHGGAEVATNYDAIAAEILSSPKTATSQPKLGGSAGVSSIFRRSEMGETGPGVTEPARASAIVPHVMLGTGMGLAQIPQRVMGGATGAYEGFRHGGIPGALAGAVTGAALPATTTTAAGIEAGYDVGGVPGAAVGAVVGVAPKIVSGIRAATEVAPVVSREVPVVARVARAAPTAVKAAEETPLLDNLAARLVKAKGLDFNAENMETAKVWLKAQTSEVREGLRTSLPRLLSKPETLRQAAIKQFEEARAARAAEAPLTSPPSPQAVAAARRAESAAPISVDPLGPSWRDVGIANYYGTTNLPTDAEWAKMGGQLAKRAWMESRNLIPQAARPHDVAAAVARGASPDEVEAWYAREKMARIASPEANPVVSTAPLSGNAVRTGQVNKLLDFAKQAAPNAPRGGKVWLELDEAGNPVRVISPGQVGALTRAGKKTTFVKNVWGSS